MVATKQQAIGLAVVSFLAIASGIAVIVLFKFTFDELASVPRVSLPAISYYWVYGLPILVTGALGVLAAFLRNNVSVGIYMAVCIICLIIIGAFTAVAALVLFALSVSQTSNCYKVDGYCRCLSSFDTVDLSSSGGTNFGREPCNLLPLSRAACALIIVSWLLMLAGSIVSCMACCCGKREQMQAGVIIAPNAPHMAYEMHHQPGAPYSPASQPFVGPNYAGNQPNQQNLDSKPYGY